MRINSKKILNREWVTTAKKSKINYNKWPNQKNQHLWIEWWIECSVLASKLKRKLNFKIIILLNKSKELWSAKWHITTLFLWIIKYLSIASGFILWGILKVRIWGNIEEEFFLIFSFGIEATSFLFVISQPKSINHDMIYIGLNCKTFRQIN